MSVVSNLWMSYEQVVNLFGGLEKAFPVAFQKSAGVVQGLVFAQTGESVGEEAIGAL